MGSPNGSSGSFIAEPDGAPFERRVHSSLTGIVDPAFRDGPSADEAVPNDIDVQLVHAAFDQPC
jgi:hypothetical protein